MSTQASSGGDPQGPGACTLCDCPRFVGNQSGCTRLGCGHGYGQHDNALAAKDVRCLPSAGYKASAGAACVVSDEAIKAAKATYDKEATAKCDEGGDPKGPGACTWPNCNCPRYVGNQSSCTRYGCWHGYGYHDNA